MRTVIQSEINVINNTKNWSITMSNWSLTQPPAWAKDAIATTKGWVDAKTGEVLVSCNRLENAEDHNKLFGRGVTAKKKRGGARPGAGRKTNKQRAEIAKTKLESGEKVTQSEADALEKVEGITVDKKDKVPVKKTARKPRKKTPAKKVTSTNEDV